MNRVELIGNVGREPEFRYITPTRRVAVFSVATTDRYPGRNGEMQEHTEWHSCEAFGPVADRVENLGITQGSRVYVIGSNKTDSWMKGDVKQKATKVEVKHIELLVVAKKSAEPKEQAPADSSTPS